MCKIDLPRGHTPGETTDFLASVLNFLRSFIAPASDKRFRSLLPFFSFFLTLFPFAFFRLALSLAPSRVSTINLAAIDFTVATNFAPPARPLVFYARCVKRGNARGWSRETREPGVTSHAASGTCVLGDVEVGLLVSESEDSDKIAAVVNCFGGS